MTGRDVAVVTPWYPNRQQPFAGAFVRSMVEATAPGCDSATVYHLDDWRAKMSVDTDARVMEAQRQLLAQASIRSATVGGATLVYAPVPVRARVSYAVAARRFAETLSAALGGSPLPQPIVHAHVGLPGGWAAVANAAPGSRVFVTEHASYLPRMLAQPDSRDLYDEVLSRVTGFFAVGEGVRQPLVETFPHHADKIQLMPNPIPFGTPRATPPTELRRWLYMGKLVVPKGVDLLLEAFAKCHADDDSLTLTIVGDGPIRGQLAERAVELGVHHAVEFVFSLPPERALQALREHDLLVHPSRLETFGMTIVESIAMGTPVLVTRCGGPERSLAGIETLASEFIDVDDNPETIAEGYRRLCKRFPDSLDLNRAREVLAERYGYEPVARAHHHAWFGDHGDGA